MTDRFKTALRENEDYCCCLLCSAFHKHSLTLMTQIFCLTLHCFIRPRSLTTCLLILRELLQITELPAPGRLQRGKQGLFSFHVLYLFKLPSCCWNKRNDLRMLKLFFRTKRFFSYLRHDDE